MELAEAIQLLTPLQVRLPDRTHPLQTAARPAAEVFLVDTTDGPAVVWLDPFWCREPGGAWHIAYASPRSNGTQRCWVDHEPHYGPHCLAYQKPVVFERLSPESPAWSEYEAWLHYRGEQGMGCCHTAA
jgi:hypothetical protein